MNYWNLYWKGEQINVRPVSDEQLKIIFDSPGDTIAKRKHKDSPYTYKIPKREIRKVRCVVL